MKKKSQPRKRIIKRKRIINRAVSQLPPTVVPPVISPIQSAPEGLPSIDDYPPWRSMSATCAYLDISLPTAYRILKTGELESYGVLGRRRVTASSIKYHMLPPGQRGPLVKAGGPYERLSAPPIRWPNSKPLAQARYWTQYRGAVGADMSTVSRGVHGGVPTFFKALSFEACHGGTVARWH